MEILITAAISIVGTLVVVRFWSSYIHPWLSNEFTFVLKGSQADLHKLADTIKAKVTPAQFK